MLAKERVRRAIEMTGPDRFPRRYMFDPPNSDIVGGGIRPPTEWKPTKPHQDEWGFTWETLSDSIVTSFGQVKDHPLQDWDGQSDFLVPNPYAPGRLDGIYRSIEAYPDQYQGVGIGITGMNRVTFLRGMEQFFVDLYTNKQAASRLLDAVFEWETALLEQIVEIPEVDGVWFADDWGTQKALMISPEMWRSMFKPLYARQFAVVRDAGKNVIFHSCGYVYDIIGDLIDIGAQALNLNQPRLLGIEKLNREFTGKVCFICPVDMQRTLINGSKEEIEKEAEFLVKELQTPQGGFIACMDEGVDHGYIPRERIQWMADGFAKVS